MKKIQYGATGLLLVALLGTTGCSSTSKSKSANTRPEDRAGILIAIGVGALKERDPTQALRSLLEAEKLDPERPELHHAKGLAFLAKGERSEAIRSVRKALDLRPEYSAAQNTLGKLFLDIQKWSEAESLLTQAASDHLYVESYKPKTNLGILYYR